MSNRISLGLLCAGLAAFPGQAQAQQPLERFSSAREAGAGRQIAAFPGRAIRVAKWATLASSVTAAAYGFATQKSADDRYDELELLCQQKPERCGQRSPDGAYADPDIERLHQDALERDRASKLLLIGSQIGLAASVALFMLDMREDATPPNIPYEPRRLRVAPREDGGAELRILLPAGS